MRLAVMIATFVLSLSFLPWTGAATAPEPWQRSPLDLRGGTDLPNDFALGLEASQAIAQYFGLVESDSLIQRINDIGYRAAMNSGRPDILFTFQVLDMDVPNAMALPGGWIFVTRGILDIGLTDAELANLLGHEISHVTHKDFSRQGRLDGLLSLLQTAAVVAVAVAASPSTQNQPIASDPGYEYPQSSSDAALAGTQVFGSVFHELLIRGYSRKLETEADEGGRRLAALAGFPREAGAALMQKLHDRIYEDREFGYWQTHPYFTDRIAAARAASTGADFPPPSDEVAAYRLKIQQGLANAAGSFRDEALADYLYELALRAGTSEGSNLSIHSRLLRFRFDRILHKEPLLRGYGPLVRAYTELLSSAQAAHVSAGQLAVIQATRDSVDAMRQALLPEFRSALARENANTPILESYIRNFPDQPDANTMRLRLAVAYRESGRPNLAAERLDRILTSDLPPGTARSEDQRQARDELLQTLPEVSAPDVADNLYRHLADPDLRKRVAVRMEDLADTLSSMETVGRFVQSNPGSAFADKFRLRLEALAETELKKARLGEALGDQQSALTTYNRIVILAPATPAAAEARRGITRIQALAVSETGH
jgi:predicted Zn-dependent protease